MEHTCRVAAGETKEAEREEVKPLYLSICVFIGIFIVLLMSTHPLPATPAGWGDFFGSATYPAVLIGLGALAVEKKKGKK